MAAPKTKKPARASEAGAEPRSLERRAIETLKPYTRNARVHSAEQVQRIAASIARFGFNAPVLITKSGDVIAGHGRLEAAKSLGLKTVPVLTLEHLDDEGAKAYRLADNRLAELATWDDEMLRTELEELSRTAAFNLDAIGWTAAELGDLLASTAPASDANDADAPKPPSVPVSVAGDVWALGEHRIICGDSTKGETYGRLLGKEKASLLQTDPPYQVDYQGGNHPQSWHNKATTRDKHWDDYQETAVEDSLFTLYLKQALAFSIERVPVYQWHASKRQGNVEAAWLANELLVHQTIIWVKARAVLTRNHFMFQFEPCFYGWPVGKMPTKRRRPPANTPNVWHVDQKGQCDGIHPTQKPVELFRRVIEWSTLPGEICLEPFSGSGTQIMAAEELHRRCYAIEISPAFVDVAVVRWQNATQGEARLVDEHGALGLSFADVGKSRRK